MGNVGVIAEYNPFHNGHAYHLERARAEAGGGRVIVAMSGDFVQRGEPAAFDKFSRARWALENGADMVLMLPAAFSLANAEDFALGGVGVLAGTGLVSAIAFGSECGDACALKEAAALLDDEPEEVAVAIRRGLSAGLSYPEARARAHVSFGGAAASLLCSPNDVLGIEYIRAINALAPSIRPIAIPRLGAAHDSPSPSGGFSSASAIRAALGGDVSPYLPRGVCDDVRRELSEDRAPRSISALSQATLYALRRMSVPDIARIPDVSEGLENAIARAARDSATLDEFFAAVKTRRYTMARLKRVAMCALLGISGDAKGKLGGLYLRVLGVRKDASGLLSELAASATLPVLARFSDTAALSPARRALHETDMFAAAVAPLASPTPVAARFDYAAPLITI